jgi:hypothetical protein
MSTKHSKDVCETCGDVKVIVRKGEICITCMEARNELSPLWREPYIPDDPHWGDVF